MLTRISKLKVTVPSVMISQSPGIYAVFCFAAHYIIFNALIAAELTLLGGGGYNFKCVVYCVHDTTTIMFH